MVSIEALRTASFRSFSSAADQGSVRFVARLKLSWKRWLKVRLLYLRTFTVARTAPGSICRAFQSMS